jgi:hypothetical protein
VVKKMGAWTTGKGPKEWREGGRKKQAKRGRRGLCGEVGGRAPGWAGRGERKREVAPTKGRAGGACTAALYACVSPSIYPGRSADDTTLLLDSPSTKRDTSYRR